MKRFVLILFVIITILIGWFLGGCFFEKRDYDYNYEHFLMQENGYNYCPYCGEELKVQYEEDKE